MKNTIKHSIHILSKQIIMTVLLISQGFAANIDIEYGSIDWYRNGPEKAWTDTDYKLYFKWQQRLLAKTGADDLQVLRRQKAIMNGNKITTEVWNYGSISRPGNTITDIVWEGLGYGYEFGPFICTEVPVAEKDSSKHQDTYYDVESDTWKVKVISDGLTSNGGETSSDGSEYWGWSPLAHGDDGTIPYADPETDRLPTSNDLDRDSDGKPDSWPAGWYSESQNKYTWPGALQQGATNSDLEIFFVVDDRDNKEFAYYPFADDSSRKGLGLEIECRYYQWANPLAEDLIFLVYKVTNKSDKDLDNMIFGMWGDPHIGGPNNWQDDLSFFDHDLNMVYAWDEDGIADKSGYIPGYFGYKFLESPGNPFDGVDNDSDGMIDESWYNGLDDDNDWDPEKNDVGLDGVPNTGDVGENDGLPTAGDPYDPQQPGEPNFEFTDLDESDMIGLTSFAAPPFGGYNRISNDDYIINSYMQPGYFDSTGADEAGDDIFLYGSGKFLLPAGQSRRFSIALLVGEDFDDLTLNATTAEQIFQSNYQFAKPPPKPNVVAVPGDEKVTLYWDDIAEDAYDPISETYDFEGYVIYRSTDHSFLDQQTITDAYGSRFLHEPLKTVGGGDARFDLDNEYVGLSDIPYANRGVSYYLGDNSGLRHSFIDSNNVVNGQTYYYAVVSYDHGDDVQQIAPTECSKNITLNPETNEIFLDVNTVRVTPRSTVAGYNPGYIDEGEIVQSSGISTGTLELDIVHVDRLKNNNSYEISFKEDPIRYSLENKTGLEFPLVLTNDFWYQMPYKNLNDSTFTLIQKSSGLEFTVDVDYVLNASSGQLQRIETGNIVSGDSLIAAFTYFPILDSEYLDGEESNPFVDGMKLHVQGVDLNVDQSTTGWLPSSVTNWKATITSYNSDAGNRYPGDYEIRFSGIYVDSSDYFKVASKFEVYEITHGMMPQKIRFEIMELDLTKNGVWDMGEQVVIYQNNGDNFDLGWSLLFYEPDDVFPIEPVSGDIFVLKTTRPFTENDTYVFTTMASKVDTTMARAELDEIRVVPNPYVAVSVFEPYDYQNQLKRGDRLIYFDNLPASCTIRIYTMAGELVTTLEHQSSIDDGQEFWNLTTKDNFPIAYGVYLYHVDAGDLGQKIGRFAVIK